VSKAALDARGLNRQALQAYVRVATDTPGSERGLLSSLCLSEAHALVGPWGRIVPRTQPDAGGVERDPRLPGMGERGPRHLLTVVQGGTAMGVRLWRSPGAGKSRPACRGIRGATTVAPGGGDLFRCVEELLQAMVAPNRVAVDDVAALIFTLQDDLGPVNPAAMARAAGFTTVPLLMVREHGGDTRVAGCLRALMLVNCSLPQAGVRHAYLRGAAVLRPDLASGVGA